MNNDNKDRALYFVTHEDIVDKLDFISEALDRQSMTDTFEFLINDKYKKLKRKAAREAKLNE